MRAGEKLFASLANIPVIAEAHVREQTKDTQENSIKRQ